MQNKFDLVIVIPVGPNVSVAYAADTINSIYYNISCSYKIIIIDDSQTGIGNKLQQQFPEADLLETPQNNGRLCGLYITLCMAYKHAIDHYKFRLLFKIDTDALIINKNPEAEAFELFKSNPSIGIAGQHPLQYNNLPWDISWPADRLYRDVASWKIIKNLPLNLVLRKWYLKAIRNGYKRGESVFGGAYFISYTALSALDKEGLLPYQKFKKVFLEEDHLFSLLIKAVGFNLGDLSSGDLPFACAWRGLPASPKELYKQGKKVIHSTRYWKELNEEQIRNYFQTKRLPVQLINN